MLRLPWTQDKSGARAARAEARVCRVAVVLRAAQELGARELVVPEAEESTSVE